MTRIADTLEALNAYDAAGGDNIWQDVIFSLDGYDEAATDLIDEGASDRFVADDVTYRYDPQAFPNGSWVTL